MTRTIVFMDCQMHFFKYIFERKGNTFDYLPSFVELPAKNQPLLDYLWDISRYWDRLQGTTTLYGRLSRSLLRPITSIHDLCNFTWNVLFESNLKQYIYTIHLNRKRNEHVSMDFPNSIVIITLCIGLGFCCRHFLPNLPLISYHKRLQTCLDNLGMYTHVHTKTICIGNLWLTLHTFKLVKPRLPLCIICRIAFFLKLAPLMEGISIMCI